MACFEDVGGVDGHGATAVMHEALVPFGRDMLHVRVQASAVLAETCWIIGRAPSQNG